MTSPPRPLLVYVHIPFCRSKCHFCDWVTEVPTSELLLRPADTSRQAYLAALCAEIRERGGDLARSGYRPRIMYWGGGTASILTEAEIRQIGEALHEVFDLSDLAEATIECSPETLSPAKLAAFREVGFRRWSSGVQSFDEQRLRKLGRSHTASEARDAVRQAAEAGFEDRSIDLLCGLPGEDLDEVRATVKTALEVGVTHVALYPYRPAFGTVLRRQVIRGDVTALRSEQKEAYRLGAQILVDGGLPEYAMSHFGHLQCASDLAYFQLHMDWIGFGSGATSLLNGEYLAHRRGSLIAYNTSPSTLDERYPAASAAIAPRLLYQALTTYEGARRTWWQERTGVPLSDIVSMPACRHLIDYLGRVCVLVDDEDGLRLRRDDIADAFIDLQFTSLDETKRGVATTASLLG